MISGIHPILDANLNRVSEGLRVIEEYTRFVSRDATYTQQLSQLRKKINRSDTTPIQNLMIRDTEKDMRARETAQPRHSIYDILKANFKRAEEALRVLEEYTGEPLYTQARYDLYQLEKEIILRALRKDIPNGIYLISDNVDTLLAGLDMGASIIQLRDKKNQKSTIFKKALQLKKRTLSYKTPLIINDFLDIAMDIDADGLHTGQDDLPLTTIRTLFGPHKLLGRTTHSLSQGKKAKQEGADYVSVGPLWETPSKPGRKGIGFDYPSRAQELDLPFVAIGGISLKNLDQLLPYHPPLVGIIRAHQEIPLMLKKLKKNKT